jgi:hypothetical protein
VLTVSLSLDDPARRKLTELNCDVQRNAKQRPYMENGGKLLSHHQRIEKPLRNEVKVEVALSEKAKDQVM